MISFNNLKKSYSRNVVLEINSLDIPTGQAFGLVGNNGAGKRTLFSLLLDLIKPTKGKVINNNIDVKESEDWKSFTSAFLDESFLISYLLPEEYFYFIGDLMPFGKRDDGSWGVQAPDLGNSYISDRPVVEALKDAFPATLLLACVAILFASRSWQ